MTLRHVWVLIRKEFRGSTSNFFIIYTVLVPLLMSFFLSAIFGTLFSEKPTVGVYSADASRLVDELATLEYVDSKQYDSADELQNAVERGAVDVGVIVPADFDTQLSQNQLVQLDYYVWGESEANHRATVSSALDNVIYKISDQQATLSVTPVEVGEGTDLGWQERLLPLIMVFVVVIGGMVVPASSLIDEREKRTIRALITSPITLPEVFLAKGVVGVVLSVIMGVVALIINQAFGSQPLALVFILTLGAIMSAEFGLLMGAFIKDMNTFFAVIKAIGLFLYAPAIVMLFPELPQWIARVFPMYYVIGPVSELTIENESWERILPDIGILFALTMLGAGLLYYVGKGDRKYAM